MVTMNEDPLALVPELIMLFGAVVALMVGSFVRRSRQWATGSVAVAALSGSLIAALATAGNTDRTIYDSSYALDAGTTAARLIVPVAALLVLGLVGPRIRGNTRESEFYVLVLLASLGSVVLAGASDLLLLSVAYLLASIPLYALAGWARDSSSAEAALKLYLLGALLGVIMLLGVTVLYGVGGGATTYLALMDTLPVAPATALTVGVVAVLGGLLFKAGSVPAHFWVPDAIEGSTTAAAAFLTTVPKVGGLIATWRLLLIVPDDTVNWRVLVAVLAAASMTLGNFAAFTQTNPKRLLAYSTISQVGYLLMAVSVAGRSSNALPALLVYLGAYTVTNLGAFAVVAALPGRRHLRDYRGLARERPALAAVLLITLLGLVGTPPTGVFVGKLTIFAATWDGGFAWLVVVAATNTVASLYYYLRWLAPVFIGRPAGRDERHVASVPASWSPSVVTAVIAAVASLAIGVGAGPLLDLAGTTMTR